MCGPAPKPGAPWEGEFAMNHATVYRKTALGSAEVASNSAGLSLEERRVLIMTDGRREVAAMVNLVDPAALAAIVEKLSGLALIEPAAPAPAPAPAAAPVAAPPTPASQPAARPTVRPLPTHLDVEQLKRSAVRVLTARLGPDAEPIALRLERCRDIDEVLPHIARAEEMLGRFFGAAAADAFRAEVLGAAASAERV
jgi:hypothetical protein